MIGSKYLMYKNKYGPFSPRFQEDLEALAKNGFLRIDRLYYEKYDEHYNLYFGNASTRQFLKDVKELIENNSKFFSLFDEIIEEFGALNGAEIKEYIYSLQNTGMKHKQMKDYKIKEFVIDPCKVKSPAIRFELDEDWYDTIEILLDPHLRAELQEAIDDVQQGNVVFYKKMI
jgi:hypothetical protein